MKFLFDIEKRPRNISELAKMEDFTIPVASMLISRWARENVVLKQKEKKGREIIIYLTDYGKQQVKLLKQLNVNHQKNKEKINEILNRIDGGEK